MIRTDDVGAADGDVPESVTEGPVQPSTPPAALQHQPTATHPDPQLVGDAEPEDVTSQTEASPTCSSEAVPTSSNPLEAAPTTPCSPGVVPTALDILEPAPSDLSGHAPHEHEEVSSSSSKESHKPQPMLGAADDDAQVQSADTREHGDAQPVPPSDRPKSESTEPPEEPLDGLAESVPATPITPELLAILSSRELHAREKTETRAITSSPCPQPHDDKPSSRHGADDMDVDVSFFDLNAMELEYPSDEEMDTGRLTSEAPLPSVDGTLHDMGVEESARIEKPPTSRPVPAEAYSPRRCRDPLPPDHPVVEFLGEIDARQPPPAHFAHAFVDLGYDTKSLLDMLACAKPECGDWDALQAELRTDKKYDAWWLRVKIALRERAVRCLHRPRIFIRSSSA